MLPKSLERLLEMSLSREPLSRMIELEFVLVFVAPDWGAGVDRDDRFDCDGAIDFDDGVESAGGEWESDKGIGMREVRESVT